MNKQEFLELSKSFTAIPVFRRLLADVLTPVSLFMNIREGADYPFLLESVEGGEQLARYSFIGRNPYRQLQFDGKKTTLVQKGVVKEIDVPYFEELKKLTTAYSEPLIPDLPRLTGGAVGFSAYDTFRLVEHLPNVPEDDLDLPEANWAFYDEIFAFDHVKHQVVLIKTVFTENEEDLNDTFEQAQQALDVMEQAAVHSKYSRHDFKIYPETLKSNMALEYFKAIVEKGKKYIYEGDIFQVVLSQRFEADMEGDSFMLYRALRMVNPSPYLFYLDYNRFTLVGSSPELLVTVKNKEVRVMPIAGTRPRGKTHEEDLELEEDLKADPKESFRAYYVG